MEKPESVISVNKDVLTGISSYDAFVYEYTNVNNGKKYVGSHLGTVGDGYWHSSRNEDFIDLFSGMSPMFEYKILAVGSYDDMKNLESKIHKDNKVVSNEMYYNLGVAGSAFKVPVRQDLIKNFVLPKIKDGDFNVADEWRKSDLLDRSHTSKVKALQVRYEDNSLITEIRDRIAAKGDASKCGRILLVERGNKTYLIINGNSTLLAVAPLDIITKLKVAIIPETFIKNHHINDEELRYIGQLMNPGDEVLAKPTSIKDLIKTLQSFYVSSNKKIKFNSTYCLNYIYSIINCSPQMAGSIATQAKKEYHQDIKIRSGKKVIDYNRKRNPKNYAKVVERTEELNDPENKVIAVHGSTGAPARLIVTIVDAIINNPTAIKFILVIHHDTDEVLENWEKKYRSNTLERISGLNELFNPVDGVMDENGIKRDNVKRIFRFEEMLHEEDDIT